VSGCGATKSFRLSSANDRQRYAYLPFFSQRPIAVRQEMVFSDPKARDDLSTAEPKT
jgi:hypothetical protein